MRYALSLLLLSILLVACGGEELETASDDVVFGTPTPIPEPTRIAAGGVDGELVLLSNFNRGDGALRVSYPGEWFVESDGPAEAGTLRVANSRTALRGDVSAADAFLLVMTWGAASDYGAAPDTLDFDLTTVLQTVNSAATDVQRTDYGDYPAAQATLDEVTTLAVVNLGGGVVAIATTIDNGNQYPNLTPRIIEALVYDGPQAVEDTGPDYHPVLYDLRHNDEVAVLGATFGDSERELITWDFNGEVYHWNLLTGSQSYMLPHDGRIVGVSLLPGRQLLVLAEGLPLRVYNADTGAFLREFVPAFGRISNYQLSPDARQVAAVVVNNEIYNVTIWEVISGALIDTLRLASGESVDDVAWDNSGTRLAVYGSAAQVRVFDVASGERVLVADHTALIQGVAWRNDDSILATASRDSNVNLWATSDNELLHSLVHATSAPQAAIFNRAGSQVLTLQTDRFGYLWDVASGDRLFQFETFPNLGGAVFSRDESLIVSWPNPISSSHEIHVVNATDGTTVVRIPDSRVIGPDAYSLALGWIAATATDRMDVGVYRVQDGRQVAWLPHDAVEGAILHPTAPIAITYGPLGVVKVFNLAELVPPSS